MKEELPEISITRTDEPSTQDWWIVVNGLRAPRVFATKEAADYYASLQKWNSVRHVRTVAPESPAFKPMTFNITVRSADALKTLAAKINSRARGNVPHGMKLGIYSEEVAENMWDAFTEALGTKKDSEGLPNAHNDCFP